MPYHTSIAAIRFLARELSLVSRIGRSAHLNSDELSDHLRRDLGLLDGRGRPEHEECAARRNGATTLARLTQSRFAS